MNTTRTSKALTEPLATANALARCGAGVMASKALGLDERLWRDLDQQQLDVAMARLLDRVADLTEAAA